MKKIFLISIISIQAVFAFSQTDYELLIKTANKRSKSYKTYDNERAIELYEKALELNPESLDAQFGIGKCYLNIAPFTNKKIERDSLFQAGISLLNMVQQIDTALITKSNLYLLDGYNKNLMAGYERMYSETQILSFFDKIDSIMTISKNRYDFENYKDKFEAIYEMLLKKKERYWINILMK